MTIEEWLGNNELSLKIWHEKYQYNDENFEDWLSRISGGNPELRTLIKEKKFLPGGRILANRGISDRKVSYSNCYVIPSPEDNLESIMECAKKLARTYSYGGGCGIDISRLRPRGSTVHNAAKESTGAVSFMDIYSQITGTISQQGRRGALMISIDVRHPDVLEFINCKNDLTRVNYANISIRVNDKFMKAVRDDADYFLRWPCEDELDNEELASNANYNTLFVTAAKSSYPKNLYCMKVHAKELFEQLVKNNWDYAEPGILYWDRMESYNLLNTNSDFKYGGVNPCGELPLPEGGSCLLGSLNLAEFVDGNTILVDELRHATSVATIALNEILDEGLPLHPLKCQRDCVREWRQIGLGTFGLADALIKLGIRYGSLESVVALNEMYSVIAKQAILTSNMLAVDEGPYPRCNNESILNSEFFNHFTWEPEELHSIKTYGLRNSQLLTCAPTGTTATMLGVSTGIEPIFAMKYTRTTKSLENKDTVYDVYTPAAKAWMEKHPNTPLPSYFVDSSMLSPNERVLVQSTVQKWIDGSISSTCNLAETATTEDVYDVYMQAWQLGCKGITVFRSGCKRTPILTTRKEEKTEEKTENTSIQLNNLQPVSRNIFGTLHGTTSVKNSACGKMFVTVNHDSNGNPVELFTNTSKLGICSAQINALTRMISLSLRAGIKVEEITDQLSCIRCPACLKSHKQLDGISCPDILAKCLVSEYNRTKDSIACETVQSKEEVKTEEPQLEICPECGRPLVHSGGCISCICGYSKCS